MNLYHYALLTKTRDFNPLSMRQWFFPLLKIMNSVNIICNSRVTSRDPMVPSCDL